MDAPKSAKKRRVLDKTLPPEISDLAPEAKLYNALLDKERKLDWTIMRKRMEIQEANAKPFKTRHKLRVFVSHTFTNQPWQQQNATSGAAGLTEPAVDFESGQGIPSWTVKIEGKLLDPLPQRKFSTFLKSMIVEFDRDPHLYPEPNVVEWTPTPAHQPQDGFTITRHGTLPPSTLTPTPTPIPLLPTTTTPTPGIPVRIILHVEHNPERYKLSNELSQVLGIQEETRVGIITALWSYIKANGLQDKNDRRLIKMDARLRNIFRVEALAFQHIPELINRLIQPADPVMINYTIRAPNSSDPSTSETPQMQAFDIELDMDDWSIKSKMNQIIVSTGQEANKGITALDEEIAQTAHQIRTSLTRLTFLRSFSEDPQGFIKKWIESQARDLDVLLGSERPGAARESDLRRSEFFRLPWVQEAVAVHEGIRVAGALGQLQGNR